MVVDWFHAVCPAGNHPKACDMARDKRATRSLMDAAGLPSPKHCLINSEHKDKRYRVGMYMKNCHLQLQRVIDFQQVMAVVCATCILMDAARLPSPTPPTQQVQQLELEKHSEVTVLINKMMILYTQCSGFCMSV
jgi:hypothetical protein